MEWLIENWYWAVGALFLLIFLRSLSRSGQKSTPGPKYRAGRPTVTQARSRPGTRRTPTKAETDAAIAFLLSKLSDVLERVVDDTVGRHFTRADRQKIAAGMIVVMTAKKISIDQLSRDPDLFAAILLESITALSNNGQISIR